MLSGNSFENGFEYAKLFFEETITIYELEVILFKFAIK